jgi:hypothetical protein
VPWAYRRSAFAGRLYLRRHESSMIQTGRQILWEILHEIKKGATRVVGLVTAWVPQKVSIL